MISCDWIVPAKASQSSRSAANHASQAVTRLMPARLPRSRNGNPAGVTPQRAAELQVVLEGVRLPAKKRDLVEYARTQDESAVAELQRLPDREYSSLDEVGEALAPVQPNWRKPDADEPRDESGQPPGGDAYLDPHAEPGAVRPSAPPSNPPQKTLEEQSKKQKEQQERQQQRG
ncbi:MAG: DUF2795 domain-containing protein [Actinobacteria bacterium]|nr:MAG: DUF2795 domain-containing protein [Actinomycetota bacterium]